jgi:two-component system, chemotaxis family, chemotaxis protein CheY
MKKNFRIMPLAVLFCVFWSCVGVSGAEVAGETQPFVVTAVASSDRDSNGANQAVDWDLSTRWEPDSDVVPAWIELILPEPTLLHSLNIYWGEFAAEKYELAVSTDGTEWQTVATGTDGETGSTRLLALAPPRLARQIRLTVCTDTGAEQYCSVREIELNPGEGNRAEERDTAPHRNRRSAAARPVAGSLKFLVVDDYATMRRIVSNLLRQNNYNDVSGAASGSDALAMLREGEFNFVICDMNMPEMTGYEVLRTIRADPKLRALPVLMIATTADREQLAAGAEAGMNGYIIKPFNAATLQEKIGNILSAY